MSQRAFHVLVRVQRVPVAASENIGPVAYVPLWWMIDDHDGSMHTVAGGAYTISIATLTSTNKEDASKEFTSAYGFYASLLDGVQCRTNDDFAGKLDAFEHAERMTDFWAQRAAAFSRGETPARTIHPMHDYKPRIGDRVRIALVLDAVVRARETTPATGIGGLDIQLEGTQEGYGRRSLFVNPDEILGIIKLNQDAPVRPVGTEAF